MRTLLNMPMHQLFQRNHIDLAVRKRRDEGGE